MKKKKLLTVITLSLFLATNIFAQEDCELECPPENVILNADDEGNFTMPDFFADGIINYSEACEDGTFSQTPAVGNVVGIGTYAITVNLEFDGVNSSCTFDLEVNSGNPGGGKCVIACPEYLFVEADTSTAYILPNYFTGDEIFFGDCDLTNVIQTPAEGSEVFSDSTEVFLSYSSQGIDETCNFILIIDPTTGINELTEFELSMYPNPSNDNVYLKSEYKIENIVLFDVTGQDVYTASANEFNVSTFEKGLYFVKVKTARGTALRRLIVE